MEKQLIPLMEFDENKTAKMSPAHFENTPRKLPEKCVVAFSNSSVEEIAKKYGGLKIGEVSSCTCTLPVYAVEFDGETIGLTTGFLGSAGVAAQLEELIAGGVKKIVACGACGVIAPQKFGALVIPTSAVRDEGTSFHYAPPSYEIEADREVAESISESLDELGLPHIFGKTWTTDAFYRETEEKIALRRSENCITVEMECSSMIAVTKFRGAKFGQILYCGDDLSGKEYDHRKFFTAADVRRNLIEFSLKCVKNL